MRKIFGTALFVATAAMASGAQAGEFDGAYAGLLGRDMLNTRATVDVAVGAFAGYNYNMGNFLIGGEIAAEYDWDAVWSAGGSALTGLVDARLGYQLAPNMMAYAKAGAGYTTGGAGSFVWDAGAGVEYMIGSKYGVRAELDRVDPTTAGMVTQYNLNLGLGMHF